MPLPTGTASLPDARPLALLIPLGLLWLAGLYLRLPVLAAPPLALDIARDLGLGQADVGALTLLPLVTIAFGALPASWAMRRIGVQRALLAGLALLATMSAARGFADDRLWLLGATFAMGLGVATLQTALPSVVGAWTPRHLALGTAAYMNGMMVGEFVGAGLTLPLLMPLAHGDWRLALALWSLPATAILVLLARPREALGTGDGLDESDDPDAGFVGTAGAVAGCGRLPARHSPPASTRPSAWRDTTLWRLGIPLGGSVVVFYAINAYMGSVLEARGESEVLATLLLAFNLSPFAASLALLPLGERWSGRRAPLVASAVAAMIGLLGFVFLPGLPGQVSAVVAGFAATVELILLVSLPPALVRGAAVGQLTAGITTIGYGIAFALPLIGGVLADAFGADVSAVLVPSLVFAALGVLPLLGNGSPPLRIVRP